MPFPIGEDLCGALNSCAREPHAFSAESRSVADQFTSYAAVTAGTMYARGMAADLQIALESRAVIDQAQGVLMECFELTPDQAFQLLAQASMATNTKVRSVAAHLVHTGEVLSRKP